MRITDEILEKITELQSRVKQTVKEGKKTHDKVAEFKQERQGLEGQVEALKESVAEKGNKLQAALDDRQRLSTQLETERAEHEKLRAGERQVSQASQEQLEKLRADLQKEKDEKSELAVKLKSAEDLAAEMEKDMASLESLLEQANSMLDEVSLSFN